MPPPRSPAARINILVGALRRIGAQPGDFIPAKAWARVEIQAFGVIDPATLRAYRRVLVTFDVIEQVGGGRGGVPIQGWRIKHLPEEPILA